MKNIHPSLQLALALALTAGLQAQPAAPAKPASATTASGNPSSAGQPAGLPPVVVTGELDPATRPTAYSQPPVAEITGLPAPLKELPVTVNTVSSEFINDVSARRTRDLVGYIPGVNASEDSGATGDLLNIRGFDFIYQSYVNGMRNRLGLQASRDFSNIDRVEIFKGPGGVEFGAGEPGGFVNYVTKKPQTTQSLTLGAEGGSWNYYEGHIDATGPLWTPPNTPVAQPSTRGGKGVVPAAPDAPAAAPGDLGLFYRLIASGDSADSFRNVFHSDGELFAPSLLWNYAEGSSVLLEVQYNHHDQPYDRGIVYLEGAGFEDNFSPIRRSFHEPDDFLDTNDTRTSLYWTHKLNDNVSFRFSAEYDTTDVKGDAVRSPLTYLLYEDGTNRWNGDSTIQRTTQRFDGNNYSYGFKPELLLNFGTGAVKNSGLLGFSYLYTDTDTRSQDGFDSRPLDLFHPVYGLPGVKRPKADPANPDSIPAGARDFQFAEELEEYGVYYQHKIDIIDRIHLLGGVRYDWYDDASGFTRNRRVSPLGSLTGLDDENVSWKTGIVGDITKEVSLFAAYSNSFQPQQGIYADGSNAEALEATSFEGGIKGSFLNKRLQTTLSVYETKRKNLLEADPNDPTFTFVEPIGTVRVRGLEFEITGKLTDDLDIQAGASWMESEITETEDPATKGNEFYNVPNSQAGIRLRYDTSRWLIKGLSIGAGVVYVGDRAGDAANSFTLPDYTRFDAGLYYRWRNWNFKVTCENVFDKRYYLASQGFADIIQPGAPRLITAGAEVKF